MDKKVEIVISGNLKELPLEYCYDRNRNVKKSGILIQFEEWQIEEIAKCSQDIVYFAEKYCFIIDPNVGKTIVKLRPYQKKMVKHLFDNRFSVILASRQIGKSTIAAIYILHYILFNHDKKAAILANKAAIAKEIFTKVRIAYERLPYWIQPGVVEWHKTSIELSNGSHCFANATTSDGIRGLSCISGDTSITLRNKNTGEVKQVTIEEYYKIIGCKNE